LNSTRTFDQKGGLMAKSRTLPAALLILLLGLQLAGCSNLTQENYDKIKMGMSFQDVEKLLGSNPVCDSVMGMKSCTWGGDDQFVKIHFMADKVVLHAARGLK
jgi:hypothetical protein